MWSFCFLFLSASWNHSPEKQHQQHRGVRREGGRKREKRRKQKGREGKEKKEERREGRWREGRKKGREKRDGFILKIPTVNSQYYWGTQVRETGSPEAPCCPHDHKPRPCLDCVCRKGRQCSWGQARSESLFPLWEVSLRQTFGEEAGLCVEKRGCHGNLKMCALQTCWFFPLWPPVFPMGGDKYWE